jgi:DNA-binding MarR family transcriptional regulator
MQDTKAGTPWLAAARIGDDVGLLLAKLHAAGSALNNRALGDFGLRERSFSVLTLACSGLQATQRELADFLGLDLSQVAGLVDDLERRGLVERAAGKQDRRAKTIVSTADGHRIHTKARALMEACEHEQLAALSDDEAGQLRMLLRKALWGGTG